MKRYFPLTIIIALSIASCKINPRLDNNIQVYNEPTKEVRRANLLEDLYSESEEQKGIIDRLNTERIFSEIGSEWSIYAYGELNSDHSINAIKLPIDNLLDTRILFLKYTHDSEEKVCSYIKESNKELEILDWSMERFSDLKMRFSNDGQTYQIRAYPYIILEDTKSELVGDKYVDNTDFFLILKYTDSSNKIIALKLEAQSQIPLTENQKKAALKKITSMEDVKNLKLSNILSKQKANL